MIVSPTQGIQGELFVSPLSDSEFCPLLLIQCLAEIPELCGFICRSVFPWSSVQVFVNYPIPPRAYIVFPVLPLSVFLPGFIDSVLSHHYHLSFWVLSSVGGPMYIKKSWGLGFHPVMGWLSIQAIANHPILRIDVTICQFSLFRKVRSIYCVVESVVLVGMTELSFYCGNHSMNVCLPFPRFPGV